MKIENVKSREFKDGYCLVPEGDLFSVIVGYRDGHLRKDALRLFAARLEKGALHEKSKVDLLRILNCRAVKKGIKRLRAGVVREAEGDLDHVLKQAPSTPRRKAVPRIALRAIAQGRLTCTETIAFLMYTLRRIPQRKPLKRLLVDERYARFTYRELSTLSGMPKANISRAVSSLKEKGFLGTVWVVKPNENQFGLLFVDGALLSVIPGAAADRSKPVPKKSTTPRAQTNNTTVCKLPTLKNTYPKTDNEKRKGDFLVEGNGGRSTDWERIKKRAEAMKENFAEQAA